MRYRNKAKKIDLLNSQLPEPLSEEERHVMEQWLETTDPEVQTPEPESLSEAEQLQIEEDSYRELESKLGFKKAAGIKVIERHWLRRVAATIALLVMISIGWYALELNRDQMTTVRVSQGEIMRLVLDDGSSVWLNGNSKARYPENFAGSIREFYLDEGEAFFDIVRDEQNPFYVRTPELQVKVLGTSFNVKSWQKLPDVRVTVVSGKVLVTKPDEKMGVYRRNAELVYNKPSGDHTRRSVRAQEVVAWREKRIYLQEVPLPELFHALEQYHGVKFIYPPDLFEKCRISLRFQAENELEKILATLETIYGIKYEISGKEVLLKPGKNQWTCQ